MPDTASVAVDRSDIRKTLEAVASGDLLPEEALARLDGATFIDIGEAKVDVGRDSRTGQPEIVYGPGKTPEQVAAIVETLVRSDVRPIIVSRAAAEQFHAVSAVAPTAIHHERSALSAAPTPLSTFTTTTPGTHAESIPKSAARPPKLAPYPTLVGTAITGDEMRPATADGSAPSIPATTITQSAASRVPRKARSRWIPATPTSTMRSTP